MSALHPLLEPYEPGSHDPFDRLKAAHLLNRAGFGGTPAEVEKVLKLGPAGAVDWLLDFPDASAEERNAADVPNLSAIADIPSNFRELRQQLTNKTPEQRRQLQMKLNMANRDAFMATWGWWLKRMAHGPFQLQEKLAFFWHGHFTTSFRDERMTLLMWEQNELLRKMAAGSFRELVHAISRDPAMLDYLNNNQNRKGHPNENYARELMELFTLGIGNYSEDDVKQAARAFTGWMHDGDKYIFNARQHDFASKNFLGHTGNFNGDDVIEIILANPACARFISSELFEYFVHPGPQPQVVEALADILRGGNYQLRPLLQAMFRSRAFYNSQAIGIQIKSPVQLVIGTIRMLDLPMPPQPQALMGPLQLMGQVPMMPPNVKGWPGGHSWVNASTIFVRYNTATRLASLRTLSLGELPEESKTPEEIVDALVARLIQRPLSADKRQVLVDGYKSRPRSEQGIREVIQLIVSMPEYQLC